MIGDAVADLRDGKFILLYDFADREGETDFAIRSDMVTPAHIRRMRKDGGGLICTAIHPVAAERLSLPFARDVFAGSGICEKTGDIPYDRKNNSSFSLWVNHRDTFTGITDRDRALTVNAIADANIIEWTVPNDATHFMLNFETTANSDSQVVSILVSASDKKSDGTTTDDFLFGGSLTLTGGQQVARHTNVYCDTATATDGVLTLVVWDTGNDRVCVVTGNAKSFKRFRIVATTLAAKTELYVNARYF